MRDRRAEDAHDRVADELLDEASERLDLAAYALVVRREDRVHVLRVELLGPRGEPDKVDEDDADDAPLLLRDRLFSGERIRAGEAESRDVGILLTTGRADGHRQRVRRRQARAY